MPVTTISGRDIHVDDEGFLTEYDEWDEDLAKVLAANIDIDLTDEHWKAIRFVRDDYKAQGETPDHPSRVLRRRHRHQEALPALPQEAGQEDVVHRRRPQAARLRVSAADEREETTMSTETQTPIVPAFDDDGHRPQARDHLQQGQPRHGLPGTGAGQRRPR